MWQQLPACLCSRSPAVGPRAVPYSSTKWTELALSTWRRRLGRHQRRRGRGLVAGAGPGLSNTVLGGRDLWLMMDVRASYTETQPFCSGPLPSLGPVSSLSSVSALHLLVYTGSLIAAVRLAMAGLAGGWKLLLSSLLFKTKYSCPVCKNNITVKCYVIALSLCLRILRID